MRITKKGVAILKDCYKNMELINEQFFGDIPKADVELCIKLLSSLEIKFASSWLTDKENLSLNLSSKIKKLVSLSCKSILGCGMQSVTLQ